MKLGDDNMPFHYWLTVILMFLAMSVGAVFAVKIGWSTYLECKDEPDEYWGEESGD